MAELVNIVSAIQKEIQKAGVTLTLNGERLLVTGPAGSHCLRLVRLYRPASADVERAAAPDVLLVLSAATQKAARAAAPFNHILVPEGGYRLILPGIALRREVDVSSEEVRQVRLMGRTGVLAESLLLGGARAWSVQELATDAHVSTTLAHRVLTRLEGEGLLLAKGSGPAKRRQVVNSKALAELWSQEEKPHTVALRGYLYANSTEALAKRILSLYPESAIGGTLAANLYKPTLTKVAPPLRVWVPGDFDSDHLKEVGFQPTGEGASIEFLQSKDDSWRVHRSLEGIARVSPWRAWLEVARVEGRTKELADALLTDLGGH
ncbi:hypothetical protein [Armatimonas sp.]|uniref:hypothetical protein n=1 Tax=Armatimonas sp. TaxID=1872638 RepID=UPI00286A277C|nr:hypothetical protein [Armatimonas sp.]